VLVCAADMPFVTPALVTRIATADPGGTGGRPHLRGELQPLLALYLPAAAAALDAGAAVAGPPAARGGRRDRAAPARGRGPRAFFNVNTPEDLLMRGDPAAGAWMPVLSEGEVVGLHAGGELDGEQALLVRRHGDEAVEALAATVTTPACTSAPASLAAIGRPSSRTSTLRGRLPTEVSTR
jgi:hypothetical protein